MKNLNPRRVLIVANYHKNIGGISGVIDNHILRLKSEGYNISLFNTKRSFLVRIVLIFALIKEIRKYSIIHIHGCSGLGFYPIFIGAIASKFFYNRRTVVTFHGGGAKTFLERHGNLARIVLNKVDYVTVMSKFLQDIFKEYNISTVVLPNLINIDVITDFNVDFKKPSLLSIRSLEKNYNVSDIINAFALIKSEYKNAELRIYGNGSEASKLIQLSKELELKDIAFIDSVPHDQIIPELMKSNIMISVPSYDNQPMSILEGFAVGIPVISTNVGGIPSLLENNVHGFWVDVNRPDQIYERVIWILTHSNEVKRIVENAKERVKLFQWDNIKDQLLNLYKT